MSSMWSNARFATESNTKPTSQLQVVQCVLPDTQREAAALQMLLRRFSQLATTRDGSVDTATLDRFKALLRLLISDERRQLTAGWPVDSPSQVSVAAAAARRVDLRRYKTELCRSFAETGQCRYGVKCQFAHGVDELRPLARHPRYRTELCHSFHVNGFCPYGSRCNFIHSDSMSSSPSDVGEASVKTSQIPQPMPLALPHSDGNYLVLKQLLNQSSHMKQRAICGRPALPDEMCPMAVMQVLGASQAAAAHEN